MATVEEQRFDPMPTALYMDHHVPRAITAGLRSRGVDVLTPCFEKYEV